MQTLKPSPQSILIVPPLAECMTAPECMLYILPVGMQDNQYIVQDVGGEVSVRASLEDSFVIVCIDALKVLASYLLHNGMIDHVVVEMRVLLKAVNWIE